MGAWSPFLYATLCSVARQQNDKTHIALLSVSDDPRIREDIDRSGIKLAYERFGPDAGQSAAIAEGWKHCDGEILAWLNADDLYLSGTLQTVFNAFSDNPHLDVFYGQSSISFDDTIIGLHPEVTPIGPRLNRTNIISQPSCFAKRKAIESIGNINPDLHYTMDWDLWHRLYEYGAKFNNTDKILSHVTWYSNTKTASISPTRLKECGTILRRSQSLFSTVKGITAIVRHNLSTYGKTKIPSALPWTTFNSSFRVINYGEWPSKNLKIRFADRSIRLKKNSSLQFVQEIEEDVLKIEFNSPIAPGETVNLVLDTDTDKQLRMVSAKWG